MSRTRAVWAATLVLTLLTVLLLARPLLAMCRSVSVMYAFNPTHVPKAVRIFRKLANTDTVLTELTISGQHGEVKVRRYEPRGKESGPVMVLVHGLAPDGRADNGLNILAGQLAANGFHVLIPEIATERDRLMRQDALYDIGESIHFGRRLNGGPISVVGISFGGGLLLRTAALPEYADDVKSILCIAGYNDLLRVGHFYINDPVQDPAGRSYTESPAKGASLLMVYQYLSDFVDAKELPQLREPILRLLGGTGSPSDQAEVLQRLPKADAKRLLELRDASSPKVHEEFEEMLARHSIQNRFISPHENLNGLKASVYILHGRIDPAIPKGEAEWNCKEVESAGADCYLEITPWLQHAFLDSHAALHDKVRVSYFVSRFLNSAAH